MVGLGALLSSFFKGSYINCIVLYSRICKAPLAVHTNQRRSQYESPEELSRPTFLVMHASEEEPDTRKQTCLRCMESSRSKMSTTADRCMQQCSTENNNDVVEASRLAQNVI